MEEKEFKINVPEGYEIDKENSTFECIKFKPTIKNLTYEEIFNSLFKGCAVDITMAYKDLKNERVDLIQVTELKAAYSEGQYKKILAINQLFNIAKYYNGDWKPNYVSCKETKYNIVKTNNTYKVYDNDNINIGLPEFKNKKDAQAVINNPNFREILDTIFKQ